jgi:hypothetical protein
MNLDTIRSIHAVVDSTEDSADTKHASRSNCIDYLPKVRNQPHSPMKLVAAAHLLHSMLIGFRSSLGFATGIGLPHTTQHIVDITNSKLPYRPRCTTAATIAATAANT